MKRTPFALIAGAVIAFLTLPAQGATIIDDWSTVKAPPPPALQSVTVDPATTALLVLDFVKQTCSGPRCTAALPNVTKVVQNARAAHVPLIYSFTATSTMADTLPPVAPLGGEPAVQAGPDKFLGTDLGQILTQKGIKTVVVMGMSAQGAVLYTASHAALTGLTVVVPVDAMPSEVPYAEQYVVWALANAPRLSANVKLTSSDKLTF
jgi:nicotinamidase-related amidase